MSAAKLRFKPTALERSQDSGRRADWRLLVPAVAVLGLALAAVSGYQLFAHYQDTARRDRLEAKVDRVAAQIAQRIADYHQRMRKLAGSAAVREALRSGDPARMETERQTMNAAFPAALRIRLVAGEVGLRRAHPFPGLTYSDLDMLRRAGVREEPIPAEVHLFGHEMQHLDLVRPVRSGDGGRRLGYLMVTLAVDHLTAPVEALQVPLGRVVLTQGEARASRTPLAVAGSDDAVAWQQPRSRAISGTLLTLTYRWPTRWLPLPARDPALLWLLLSAGAIAVLLAVWTRLRFGFAGRRRSEATEAPAAGLDAGKAAVSGPTTAPASATGARMSAASGGERATPAASASTTASSAGRETGDKTGAPGGTGSGADNGGKGMRPDASLFRAYDIRGIVGETLTEEVTRAIGQAFASEVRSNGHDEVAVARDGRLSGPQLVQALCEGVQAAGCNVVDLGAVPTPLLYYATHEVTRGDGIMLTGSHNPPNYNGFKMVVDGDTLAGADIQALRARIERGRYETGSGGAQELDVVEDYVERIAGDVQLQRNLRVVVDAGNGIGGAVAPALLEAIGAEVIPLYCEVDGHFPNHHPDPTVSENVRDLVAKVRETEADIGVALDGDGDRLGVVTAEGDLIHPDTLLMLYAKDVLTRRPGATIVYDVKCTGRLADVIVAHGGTPLMWKTGHSLIKRKMRETDAALAGEMSGHFFFRERWYGFDDALYAAARLLELLAADERPVDEQLRELPKGISTPEIRVDTAEGEQHDFVERFQKEAALPGARISTIDGVRADFDDGWGLVRASNTTPCLVLRFEGDSEEALARVKTAFRKQIHQLDPDLELPF